MTTRAHTLMCPCCGHEDPLSVLRLGEANGAPVAKCTRCPAVLPYPGPDASWWRFLIAEETKGEA